MSYGDLVPTFFSYILQMFVIVYPTMYDIYREDDNIWELIKFQEFSSMLWTGVDYKGWQMCCKSVLFQFFCSLSSSYFMLYFSFWIFWTLDLKFITLAGNSNINYLL